MSRALIHANIYLLPVIVLFIISLDVKKSLPRTLNTHFFMVLVWQIIIMMVVEACTWIPDGAAWKGAGIWVWITNILYLMMNTGFAFTWFIYIYSRIPGKEPAAEDRKGMFLFALPMMFHWMIMILTPWTHWVFHVNESNTYVRGPLYGSSYLLAGGYMIFAIALAFKQRKKVMRTSEKKVCIRLAIYATIPIGGLLLQLLDYKFWSVWPFTALAILTIYVSMQNGQITTDGLTRLNNRRQLDQYLISRCEADDGKPWCMIILDVDNFKGINDAYGHIAGDQVLCRVAEILKKAYGGTDAFLARFGGDEFAVVVSCDSPEDAEDRVRIFYDALEEYNRTSKEPYKLALSAGYACYDGRNVNDRHSLMMAADEAMYRKKQQKKSGELQLAQ